MIRESDSLVNESNIDAITNASHRKVQVLWFFAEWCGHCRNMHDEWEKASMHGTLYADWHKVDCANDGISLANAMSVKSFPTLVYIVKGNAEHYHGERNSEKFISFARLQSASVQ